MILEDDGGGGESGNQAAEGSEARECRSIGRHYETIIVLFKGALRGLLELCMLGKDTGGSWFHMVYISRKRAS